MVLRCSQWCSVILKGSLRFSAVLRSSQWFSVVFKGSQRFFEVFEFSVVLSGSQGL